MGVSVDEFSLIDGVPLAKYLIAYRRGLEDPLV
jgi:hypothetical protein